MTRSGTPADIPVERRLYGRRKGRPLKPGRRRLMAALLPRLAIRRAALDGDGGPDGSDGLDPGQLFSGPPPFPGGRAGLEGDTWLEVGFGAGEHLAAQAEAHPQIRFIGCEPFENGVASLLARIEAQCLDNIRIFADDALILLDRLRPRSISRVFVLFPDPWPKARHAGRRFFAGDAADRLARVMADGAELRVATDHPVYLRWALGILCAHRDFEWSAERPSDWRTRPSDQPETRYEQKARDRGVSPVFLVFRRTPRATADQAESRKTLEAQAKKTIFPASS